MNNTFFNKDIFPNQNQYNNVKQPMNTNYNIPLEPLYIESIIRLNRGKQVKVYMTFPTSNEIIEFKGIIEQSGKDNLIISEPSTGKWQRYDVFR